MSKSKTVNPLGGNIFKNMLLFALPIMGMMIMSMFFSSMDTLVISRFGHKNAVAAIGVSGAFINMISGGISSLGGGATIVLSNLYGQNRKKEINDIINVLPLTGMVIGGAIALTLFASAHPILQLLQCQSDIMGDALIYFRIYFLTLAVSLPYNFLAGALNAKGDSFTPFLFELIAQVVNIGLNLFTVIVLDWNIFGVAIATLISQIVSLLLILIMFTRRNDELKIEPRRLRLFKGTGEIFKLGIPSSIEGIVINFSGVVISAYINRLSADVISGNTIGQSIEGFIAVSFVGFSSASIVFISQNFGAGNMKRVRKCYLITALSVIGVAELLGVLMYQASPALIGIFTSDANIAYYARLRMFYMCMFYGLCGGMNVISGCIRGLKDTIRPLIVSIVCSVIVRLSWVIFYAGPSGDIKKIYVAFPICWALSTVLSIFVFEFDFFRAKRRLKET